MKIKEFLSLCGELFIDPAVALENDEIRKALKEKDSARVRELLETEF